MPGIKTPGIPPFTASLRKVVRNAGQVQRRLRATVLLGALEFGVVLERPAKDTVSGFLIVHVNSKFSIYFN
jgi:hypothetical protein